MKKTKLIPVLLACSLLFAGCGGKEAKNVSQETGKSEPIELRMIHQKSEVEEPMKALAEAFNQSQSEIHVTMELSPAGADLQSTLKGYYLADTMPDIISCEVNGFEKWEGLLADLSDQAWVADTDAAYTDKTYGTIGFPYTTEAIGLAYNADLLKKAGVDPSNLTSPSAYQKAFALLDSKKNELGLTAVVGYYTEAKDLYWSSGNHIFGNYLDAGLDRSDTTYIDLLKKGKLDKKRFMDYAKFIGMLNRYSDPVLLTSGSYDDQLNGFASGKYAFVTQGSWIGAALTGAKAEEYQKAGSFQIGMAPYAFEDGIDTILTSSPSWWAVMKEGHVEAAKTFLSWCASDPGQKILVEKAGFISPYKSCTYVASDPFAASISSYLAAGKTSAWHWMDTKEGTAQYIIAPVFNDYAKGKYDAAGFTKAMQEAVAKAYAN